MSIFYVSLFPNATTTKRPQHVSAADILHDIKTGAYRKDIERLRKLLKAGKKTVYDANKKRLPGVTFAGMFSERKRDALETPSGLFHVDLDHVPDVPSVKRALSQDASVVFAFTSPGGDGVKAAFRIPPVKSDTQYKRLFALIKERVKERVNLPIDESRKDISGLCFVSYDPELYFNENAATLPIDAALLRDDQQPSKPQAAVSRPDIQTEDATIRRWLSWDIDTAIRMIDRSQHGNRNDTLIKAGKLLGGAVSGYACHIFSEEEAFSALSAACDTKNPETPEKARNTLRDGIKYGMAEPITMASKQADFDSWKETHPLKPRADRPPHPAEAYNAPAPNAPAPNAPAPSPEPTSADAPQQKPPAKEAKPAQAFYSTTETELKTILNPLEQAGIREKLLDTRDPVFDLNSQYPLLYDYCWDLKTVTDAKPQALITALLPALACNVGNRAYIQAFSCKHFCNIWAVNIGRSTIGRKTTSLNLPLKPLHDVEKEMHTAYAQQMKDFEAGRGEQPKPKEYRIYPNTTSESFFDVLQDSPNGLMVFSEIASFLSSMSKSYMADFKANFVDFFDTPAKRSRRTRGTGETVIEWPCFSVSAATTKDWLIAELNRDSQNDVHSGFLQRFLLCNSYDINVNELNFKFTKGGAELAGVHNKLARLYHGLSHVATPEHPIELELSDEAAQLYEEVQRAIYTDLAARGTETLLSYAGRIFTGYFLRLCILFTLCDHVFKRQVDGRTCDDFDAGEKVVSLQTAKYAMALCEYYFRCAQAFIMGEVEKTQEAQNEKQIIRAIQNYQKQTGKNIISRKLLMQRIRLDRKDLDTALANLFEQGIVTELKESPKQYNTRPAVFYALNS